MVRRFAFIAIATVVVVIVINSMLFTVDEARYAIVTTFGKPVRTIKTPGLHWKWPAPAQTVLSFDKRTQVFDPRPTENLTLDRKNIVVDSYACWRIADPNKFLVKVQTMVGAENSLGMLVTSELSTELGKHNLSALVSTGKEQNQLAEIVSAVTRSCETVAAQDYGIEILDVRIKRINLPEENKDYVYERMRAERQEKATRYRAEGEQEALRISGETDQKVREIRSKAYADAQRIKGEADAKALRIYAEAYSRDPAFYKFMRTLQSYEKILGEDTTVIMSSRSELLKLLTDFDPTALMTPVEHNAPNQSEVQTPRE